MRSRLFAFLSALVITMVLGVITILMLTGLITDDRNEAKEFLQKEVLALSHDLSAQCGESSMQLVQVSESLAKSVENRLAEKQIRVQDLKAHPELLEDIIGAELSRLQLALEKTDCTGVFMVLDATVNPSVEGADHSRAGICIRNAEPKLSGPDMKKRYVVGFPEIAHQNGMAMLSNWSMEFDVKDRSFYHQPIDIYNETRLSRLYYWSFESIIPGSGERAILCSIPLIDSSGEPFGICGFEISAINFESNYQLDNATYSILCVLSPMDERGLETENALFAGKRTALDGTRMEEPLSITSRDGLERYTQTSGKEFIGLHETVKLYPNNSPMQNLRFAVSLLIPKEEMDTVLRRSNIRLILICASLLLLGIAVSFFISTKYLKPIITVFDGIRADALGEDAKTNIREIDELIGQIKAQRINPLPDDLFEDFISRVKTLTPTETVLFRYYLEGKTTNEILSLMFISMSTLKTHNGHIYSKLNVSSRDELMLYLELIKKSGRLTEIA